MTKRSGRSAARRSAARRERAVRASRIQSRGYMAGDLPPEKAGPPPKGPMAGFHGAESDRGAGKTESPDGSANPSEE